MEKETVRLNFEFPIEEYPYLKLLLANKRVSLREFATKLLIRAIEEAEDDMSVKRAHERLSEMKPEDLISWDEAKRISGWDK